MYRIALGLFALMLTACERPAEPVAWRNPAAMISSAALFDPARFQGEWEVVATYGPEGNCGPLRESWAVEAGRFAVRGNVCGRSGKTGYATKAQMIGPGRITRPMPAGPEEIWVLWVDADYRVAAIGTPSGQFGRIIARPGQARADLLTAARSVLDFNGYDLSKLRMLR